MRKTIRQDIITGSRRLSNFFWSFFLVIGGISFILSGISSYFKINFLLLTNSTQLTFIPQGAIMIFYGTISLILGVYVILTIIWNVGSGYNEYDKTENIVKIMRKGFPGKNEEILLTYPLESIKAIGIKVSESLNPTRNIYLCLFDDRIIPLSQVQQPNKISSLEEDAAELAKFLNLNLETI